MKRLTGAAEWIVLAIGALIGLFILILKIFHSFSVTSKEYSVNVLHFFLGGLLYAALFLSICFISKKISLF